MTLKTTDEARKLFSETYGSLASVSIADVFELCALLERCLTLHNNDPETRTPMWLRPPNAFQIKKLRRVGFKGGARLEIKVDGGYFEGREGYHLHPERITFASWASSCNLQPFLDAFEEWCLRCP